MNSLGLEHVGPVTHGAFADSGVLRGAETVPEQMSPSVTEGLRSRRSPREPPGYWVFEGPRKGEMKSARSKFRDLIPTEVSGTLTFVVKHRLWKKVNLVTPQV